MTGPAAGFVNQSACPVLNPTLPTLGGGREYLPMSALRSLKKHWYWAGLLTLGGAITAAALIVPSDMSRLLSALTLLVLGAGVALHPALALILDREQDAQPSYREKYDVPSSFADRNTFGENPTKAMGEFRLALDRGEFELVY
jgi:hypothetical protein